MALGSPTTDLTHALVFGEDASPDEESINAWCAEEETGNVEVKRQSMYVELFEGKTAHTIKSSSAFNASCSIRDACRRHAE